MDHGEMNYGVTVVPLDVLLLFLFLLQKRVNIWLLSEASNSSWPQLLFRMKKQTITVSRRRLKSERKGSLIDTHKVEGFFWGEKQWQRTSVLEIAVPTELCEAAGKAHTHTHKKKDTHNMQNTVRWRSSLRARAVDAEDKRRRWLQASFLIDLLQSKFLL